MPDPAIPFATLVAYASGEMTPAEAAAFERRLTTTGLSTVATRLREIITTLRRDDSEAPTEAAVRRALAEFRPTPATATPMGTPLAALRRIVAELVFDSRRQTTLAGFRGGVAAYQLGFESTLGRVGVQISETKARDAGWRLRGQ
ncbi:MAG: hypothetical protein HKO59_10885, partial [Phycisphaerales bacterium]|nr:hypothetical protein [Phycisphaerales bacterium]